MKLDLAPDRAEGGAAGRPPVTERAPTRGAPPLVPWLAILFVGAAALGLYFLIAPALGQGSYYRSVLHRSTYGYNRLVLLLFVPYALALWAWWRGRRVATRVLLAGAVLLHVVVLFAPLPQSQDFYQYLFYGRMQAAFGHNPYIVQPQRDWLDAWYSMIRWPYQTSVYGPVWTLLSFGVAKAAGSSFTRAVVFMKLAILAMDLGIMACIMSLAKDREDPDGAAGWGLLAYAWNPLILITVPLGGLADVGVAAAILAAMMTRRRGRNVLTTVLLTAAMLIKVYGGIALLLHLVLLLKRRGTRDAAKHGLLAGGMAALAFAPYWGGFRTFRGLIKVADLSNKSFTGTIQRLLGQLLRVIGVHAALDDAAAIIRWLVFPLMLFAVVWAIRRTESDHDVWYGTMVVLSLYVFLTPWYLYWYLVAPLALAAVLPKNRFTFPLLVFSGTTLITARFPPWLLGEVVQADLRYGPPIGMYFWARNRERQRGTLERGGPVDNGPARLRPGAEAGRFATLV